MKIEKANWGVDGDQIRLSMPLQKVDKKRRIVSGFATLDNEDLHGDVVTKEASTKAFSRFRGNIRLMHQPIPAGKLVNFREEEYYDPKTEKFYSGIYVDAYVSEGAENIWKMVLDGTLTGFSIGGNVVDAESQFVKEAGKTVRFIKDYEMVELSLVDNPANQLSNIFSIQKTADGNQEVEGMIAQIEVQNVFYCKKGEEPIAVVGSDEEKTCVDCGAPMQNIGWFESDGGDRAEKVNNIIARFEADETEGGENMAKANKAEEKESQTPQELAEDEATQVKSAEEVSPKGDDEVIAPEGEEAKTATDVEAEAVTVTGTGEVKVDEAKELNEATKIEDGAVEENPLTKMFDDLRKSIESTLDDHGKNYSEALTAATEKFEKGLEELATKHEELSNKFGTLTEKFNGVQEKLGAVEKSGAVRKSADLGGSEEESSLQKSNKGIWRGSIFSMDAL
jgi:hypothetical protein